MNCPSCAAPMTAMSLDGHLGTRVDLDLCHPCQVIWFDHRESLRLSPGATLHLFRVIGERNTSAPPPLREPMKCPTCGIRLLLTNDRQRNTAFRYWRCGKEHGRLTTFFDFLREKDFVRPLSPPQLAALRQNIQTINCSNCGAPVDLIRQSACAHCATPISTLDLQQIGAMAAQLHRADERSRRAPDFNALFESMKTEHASERESRTGLVEAGLRLVARWLS